MGAHDADAVLEEPDLDALAVQALAAQHPAYTASQLAAWVGGGRNNSDVQLMNEVARNLSDADRRAVADYLATMPPVPAVTQERR